MLSGGVHTVAENGVIGDPARSSARHGARYWDAVLEIAMAEIDATPAS